MSVAVFLLGVSVGAIVESRRKTLLDRIDSLEKITQEILVPLGNKADHVDMRQWTRPSTTWVDYEYEYEEPEEITMELPKVKIEERGQDVENEEAW